MHNAARVARSLGVKSYDRDSEDMLPVYLMYIVVPRGRAARSYDRQLGNTLRLPPYFVLVGQKGGMVFMFDF